MRPGNETRRGTFERAVVNLRLEDAFVTVKACGLPVTVYSRRLSLLKVELPYNCYGMTELRSD